MSLAFEVEPTPVQTQIFSSLSIPYTNSSLPRTNLNPNLELPLSALALIFIIKRNLLVDDDGVIVILKGLLPSVTSVKAVPAKTVYLSLLLIVLVLYG